MTQPLIPIAITNDQLGAMILALIEAEAAKQNMNRRKEK